MLGFFDWSYETRMRRKFQKAFGLEPENLEYQVGQKEALILLAIHAADVANAATKVSRLPGNWIATEDYRKAHARYRYHLQLVHHFAPSLWKDIPHWSELPPYLKRWFQGEEIDLSAWNFQPRVKLVK